jgi:hypothetical protein
MWGSIKAALVAAALMFGNPAILQPASAANATPSGLVRSGDMTSPTDVSARRRAHRSHRHVRRHARHHRAHRPMYLARPYHYRPYRGMSPFFPFGLGYGLEPSW